MRGTCRYCGARSRHRLEQDGFAVCRACDNSPLCDECGHHRSDHGQVFVGGVPSGCHRRVGDFQSLTSELCACPGFRPVSGPLREAKFAEPDPDPLQLGLRVVRRLRD